MDAQSSPQTAEMALFVPNTFVISLCEIGDRDSCLYVWACTRCALANSRSKLDGSPFCFNIFCSSIVTMRWLVRSAYGIGDIKSCWTDCCLSCCCPCCVVNQLYHQTTSRRNPTVDGGYQYNNDPMSSVKDSHFVETVIRCLFSTCLLPCEIGRTMEAAMGMPYFLGCCCMGFFAARNIVRYHYRLKRSFAESDVAEECIWPMCLHSLGIIVVPVLPCLWSKLCICIYPALAMELAREVEIKTAGGKSHAGYLVGYHPPLSHSAAPVSMEISPPKC